MGPYEAWQLRFLARTLSVNQILGDHRNLGGTRLRLRWSAFYALGERDEPDQRVVKYGYLGSDQRRWIPTADRLWSALSQTDIGATTQLRFPLWAEAWGTIGGRIAESNRDFSNRRFVYQMGSPDPYTADPETLFSNQGVGTIVRVLDFTNTRRQLRVVAAGLCGLPHAGNAARGSAVGVGGRASRSVLSDGAVAEPVRRGQHARKPGDEPHRPDRHERASRRGAEIRGQQHDAAPRRLRHDGQPPTGPRARPLRLLRLPPRSEDQREPEPQDRHDPQPGRALGVVLRRGPGRRGVRLLQALPRSDRASDHRHDHAGLDVPERQGGDQLRRRIRAPQRPREAVQAAAPVHRRRKPVADPIPDRARRHGRHACDAPARRSGAIRHQLVTEVCGS